MNPKSGPASYPRIDLNPNVLFKPLYVHKSHQEASHLQAPGGAEMFPKHVSLARWSKCRKKVDASGAQDKPGLLLTSAARRLKLPLLNVGVAYISGWKGIAPQIIVV